MAMRLVVADLAPLLRFSVTVSWKKIIPRQDESGWFQAIERFSLAVSRLRHISSKANTSSRAITGGKADSREKTMDTEVL